MVYGIDKLWVHEMFLADPSTRSLWFQIQWFCAASDIVELTTDYARLVRVVESNLYQNHFYHVDALVNYQGVGGYLDLLDTTCQSLEEANFKVKRVILEFDFFKAHREIGMGGDPFYAKPKNIDLFRQIDAGDFTPLDSMEESLMTLPFRQSLKDDNTRPST